MPWVGFEPTIPEFERAKAFHALDRTATVIGARSSTTQGDNEQHRNYTKGIKQQVKGTNTAPEVSISSATIGPTVRLHVSLPPSPKYRSFPPAYLLFTYSFTILSYLPVAGMMRL
jgi:hypothetical protein